MGFLGDLLPKAKPSTSTNTSAETGQNPYFPVENTTSVNTSGSTPISAGGSFSNFNLASIPQKVGEGAKKLFSSLGGIGKFNNISNGLPQADLASQLAAQGIGVGNGQVLSDYTNTDAPRTSNDDVIVKLQSTVTDEIVKLVVSPRISESRSAQYSEVNITHHPGGILKYEKTNSRSWNVSAKLVSRTQSEASENQKLLNIVRGWVMPYYGAGTEKHSPEKLGAPPPIIKFSGYGVKNISPIPTVVESYNTSWPNDVDYIPTLNGDPFPVIMDIEITLKEAYSPGEYSRFNLFAYKSGILEDAFSGEKFSGTYETCKANDEVQTDTPVLGASSSSASFPTISAVASGTPDISMPTKILGAGSFDSLGKPSQDISRNPYFNGTN